MDQIDAVALHEAARYRYLNYALSVITARALPDVRDGLKPVQRRILYAMYHNLKLVPDGRFRKSAAAVGEVMAKYHPHGDTSIYDALVRMAQPFSLRHTLVEGQGNFGSLDGDSAAAMRYTECKLTPVAVELLSELRQRTVDYRSNYDGQHFEPIVLPAQFPQLLVNGAEGIAVGMATRIPPHNLKEIIAAATALIDDPQATVAQLCRHVRGPDFPTGGAILNSAAEILEIYTEGSGSVRVQGTWKLEDDARRPAVVVTSIPYGLNKATLVEKIGELIAARRIPQLTDVRDESTDDVRIVLELRKVRGGSLQIDARAAMAYLFRHTPLQGVFPVNLTCLIPTDNPEVSAPARLDLREVLRHWLDFRRDTVRRRFEYDLQKLQERIHILDAFAKIFAVLDEVIAMIRSAEGKRDAAEKLIARFDFSDEQAEAILELRLYKLAKLEINAVLEELQEKRDEAERIERILSSVQNLWGVVRNELQEVRRLYGEKRRTSVGELSEIAYDEDAYILAENAYLIVTRDGWIKRQSSFVSVEKIRIREGDQVLALALADTRRSVTFFTDQGGAYVMRLDDVPATTGYGEPIQKHFSFGDGERVVGVAVHDARALPAASDAFAAQSAAAVEAAAAAGTPMEPDAPPPHGIAVTRNGRVLRFPLAIHEEPSNRTGRRYARLDDDGDAVVAVYPAGGDETVCLATEKGRGLCFPVSEIPVLKGAGKGVIAIKLEEKDRVLGYVLTEDATEGVRAVSPQKKEEIISPDRYGGSRAGKGKVLFRRGSFQPWDRPLLRYDVLYRQEEDEPAEGLAGLGDDEAARGADGADNADDEGEE